MKTKTRTIIGLVALGVISFTSNNATAANSLMSSFTTVETEENLTIEDWMLNSILWIENTPTKVEKAETEKPLVVEEWMTEEEFFKAAESYTAAGSDKEIEKYADQQIENSIVKAETENLLEVEEWMTDEDFFKVAESYTASGSANEVSNYATKLIELEDERQEK